jgi:hypothetical protein
MSEITIQTVIPRTNENKIGIDYITEFGINFGRCIRTAFNMVSSNSRMLRKKKVNFASGWYGAAYRKPSYYQKLQH